MSWYIYPSKELCDDELPPELVLTNHDGSIVQAYVPYNAIDQLNEENARLREELAKARDPQRIGGQADPISFAYAIEQLREFRWQHATNDEDAIPYINNVAAAHERENAKLREELDQWHSLTAGIELPEYPMTQFQPKDLERENAKLREDMEDLEGYDQMLRDRLRQVTELKVKADSENAKLRALLQDVAICASGNYCYDCPHQYDGCDRDERLRAEGIEVDE